MYRFLLLVPLLLGAERGREPLFISRPDAFNTLVNPTCSHCVDEAKRRAGELRPEDPVLSWIRGYSNGGAIPIRFFLNPYRVISDTYGVFVYDPDAGFARGFAPSLDFRFHGWRNGVMVMRHKDGTLYSCLTGLAFEGPQKGQRLQPLPAQVTTWGDYLKRYPRGVAYQMFDKYQPIELPTQANADSRKSRGPADSRLPGETPVLGVFADKSTRAYPLDTLARVGLVQETVNGQQRVILWYAPTRTASAFHSLAEPAKKNAGPPRPVTLALATTDTAARIVATNPPAPFVDKETGSRWDIEGRAVEGPLVGWTLEWLDSTQVKWFAWAAEYPDTTLYRGRD